MAKQIILEDTGERRTPKGNELYLYRGEVFNAEDARLDDFTSCDPSQFTILRVVRNDWTPAESDMERARR